jgi:SAM-dependent methyltransferase
VFEEDVRPRLLAPAAELLLEALPPLAPQMRFLEIQAGGGVLSRSLVERIAGLGKLVAIDDDDALASGLPAASRRAVRLVASLPSLPLNSGAIDVAVANLVFHGALADDVERLAEVRRVLRPAGWLLMSVFADGSFGQLLDVIGDIADDKKLSGVSAAVAAIRDALRSADAIRETLASAGFSVSHVGIEERILGLYRGRDVVADPLMTRVLLADVIQAGPPTLMTAVAQAVDGWFPGGMPIVLKTAIVTARPLRPAAST